MSEDAKSMDELQGTSLLTGASAHYLEGFYEAYLEDPQSVPDAWREYFSSLPQVNGHSADTPHSPIQAEFLRMARAPKQIQIPGDALSDDERRRRCFAELLESFRLDGHLSAHLNPIQDAPALQKQLTPEYHGLSAADLKHTLDGVTIEQAIAQLRDTYCGSVGAEFMHITTVEERNWLCEKLESVGGRPKYDEDQKRTLLKYVTAAEGMERYLAAKYPGAKRFSLEGGESFLIAMNELIQLSGTNGVKEVVIGMAHRGRLNVLINTLGKRPDELFGEFEGKHTEDELVSSGDVKYHQGFSADIETPGGLVHIALAFNPSHLEIVGPVVCGSTRARQSRRSDTTRTQVMPILVHGDAAFAGQGVNMELLNMAQTQGYRIGGAIHLVVNNHIGFTTSNSADARSTLYCTDVAKMIQAPIFHVNGDDPEAVMFMTELAVEYRAKFQKDVVIDISCYRRHGHNEADEPAITQPLMYTAIRKHPRLQKLYADVLVKEGAISHDDANKMVDDYRDALDQGDSVVGVAVTGHEPEFAVDWSPYKGKGWVEPYDSSYDKKKFVALAKKLFTPPEGVNIHSRVKKVMSDRLAMAEGKSQVDWGFGENMAYATLLEDGYPIRLSGQDCGRGTFSHRHAVLHDQKTGEAIIPLKTVSKAKTRFNVINSLLSEEAVLAFEYGYSTTEPRSLVIWEAQFGDFANGAQVVIDQFVSSGEQKWGRLCNLVMLLPHGYEGQGPEHSSARLERYLQACAQHNIQVCVPSTPAQVYHMLRRQMVRNLRRPLVVMTPKSLLRHKLAVSSVDELVKGKFETVIPEIDKDIDTKKVKRVVICSGKVYYDLLEARRKQKLTNVALVRIEQLYPFPEDDLRKVLKPYAHVKDMVWCQEEPLNQGAWYSSQHHLRACLKDGQSLNYAGREASAAPAVGYAPLHAKQQESLIEDALIV